MQSFHQSRSRIAFEVLCALGMSASFAGAWMQTYAPAFVPAAGIAALYGVVRALDMIRRKPATTVAEPVVAKPEVAAAPPATSAHEPVDEGDSVIRSWPLNTAPAVEEIKSETPPRAKAPRKKKQAAKGARAVKEPEVAELAAEPLHAVAIAPEPEVEHAPIAPLFEPEPFVRTQRAAFGRKAG